MAIEEYDFEIDETEPQDTQSSEKIEFYPIKPNIVKAEVVKKKPKVIKPSKPKQLPERRVIDIKPLAYKKGMEYRNPKYRKTDLLSKLLTTGSATPKEQFEIRSDIYKEDLPKIPYTPPTHSAKQEIFNQIIVPAAKTVTEIPRGVTALADLITTPISTNEMLMFEQDPKVREKLLSGSALNDPNRPTIESTIGKPISDVATGFIQGQFPHDPRYKTDTFESKIPGAIGSAIGFVGTGLAGKALKIPTLFSSAGLGATLNIAEIAQEADRMGIDPAKRRTALAMAGLTGITEGVGLGRALKNFGLTQTFTKRLVEVAEEGGQEALQTWLNNLNAKVIGGYDPKRPLSRDVLENAIIGGGIGAGFQTISTGLSKYDELKQRKETLTSYKDTLVNEDSKKSLVKPELPAFKSLASSSLDNTIPANEEYIAPRELPIDASLTDESKTFDLLPGLSENKAGYLRIPEWAMKAVSGSEATTGYNIPLEDIEQVKSDIIKSSPSSEHTEIALKSIDEIVEDAKSNGLNSISLSLNNLGRQSRGVVEHETFHSAQVNGLVPDIEWSVNHPIINTLLTNNPDLVSNSIDDPDLGNEEKALRMAIEIPAYTVQGKLDVLGLSSAEGIDFTMDYYKHLLDTIGPDALQQIKTTARLRPEMIEALNLAESFYQSELDTSTPVQQPVDSEKAIGALASIDPSKSFKVNDEVTSKGLGKIGKITQVFDDGVEVDFGGELGKTELTFEDISKLPQQLDDSTKVGTKTYIPKLPGPMRIKDTLVGVSSISPGKSPGKVKVIFNNRTEAQLDINEVKDSRGRRIEDPARQRVKEDPPTLSSPTPPSPPNGISGDFSEDDLPSEPLFRLTLNSEHNKQLTRKFSELLESNNITYDFTQSPSKQIYEALVSGKLNVESVEKSLADEGLTLPDLVDSVMETVSEAGRILGDYSRIVQRHWSFLAKTNPVLANKLFTPTQKFKMILKDLDDTILGRSLWQRSGGLTQKMVLTQLSTAAINAGTTVARLPLEMASSGLGAWAHQMKDSDGDFITRLHKANDNALETMKATWEVARALNPKQLYELLHGKPGTEFIEHTKILKQLEQFFPDIHNKLFAKPMVNFTDISKGYEQYLTDAEILLLQVKDKDARAKLEQSLKIYKNRLKFNQSALGKTFNGIDLIYDKILTPMQVGEYLFRRPMFVGQLRLELKDRGIDLDKVLQNTQLKPDELALLPEEDQMTFQTIPKDVIQSSLEKALDLTYAYDPRSDKDASVIEQVSSGAIKLINKLGPIGAAVEMFPRAMFNGAKFMYEYSPLPVLTGIVDIGIPRNNTRTAPALTNIIKGVDNRNDWNKMGRAAVGTMLYGTAFSLIAAGASGDEWWQLKTGKKGKDGRPIYYDIRRIGPYSRIFQLAHLVDRIHNGTVGDKQIGNEVLEAYTGLRRTPDNMETMEILNSTLDWWNGNKEEQEGTTNIRNEVLGRAISIPLTPLLNIRSLFAQFSDEENIKKDLRGQGLLGPSIDKIPWLRRDLPDASYPGDISPRALSEIPLLQQLTGIQTTLAPTFAGREWQRMGINVRKFLPRDPNPEVNRYQDKMFNYLINAAGENFMYDKEYLNSSNDKKMMMWENIILGDDGMSSAARKYALGQVYGEEIKRDIKREIPGRYTRKVMGIDDAIKKATEKITNETKQWWNR